MIKVPYFIVSKTVLHFGIDLLVGRGTLPWALSALGFRPSAGFWSWQLGMGTGKEGTSLHSTLGGCGFQGQAQAAGMPSTGCIIHVCRARGILG